MSETNYGKRFGYDDWIGIYPCDIEFYKHPETWLWACGEFGKTSRECTEALESGDLTFKNPMPEYTESGNHIYPVTPFMLDDNVTVNTCFQAALLRHPGLNPLPYVKVCESQQFDILEGSCGIRHMSGSYPHKRTVGTNYYW